MKIEIRPYQQRGITETFDAFKQGFKRIILVLAMGLGKTTLMGRIIQLGYQRGRKILVVVHRDNLVRQFADRLRDQFDVPSGYILGSEKKDYWLPIQIASRQSLARRLDVFTPDHFDLIVIDEAHYAAGKEYQSIIKKFEAAKMVGITATPFREDGKPLKNIFDKLVHPIKCQDAINQGYLCRGVYYGIGNINMDGVTITKKGDYDEGEMYSRFSEWDITPHVVTELGKFSAQTIIFCINVAHTIEVHEAVKVAGYSAEYVTGDTDVKTRNERYVRFREGKIQVLINCEILTEGADFPAVENIFLVKKTRSLARYLQMVGRGARTHEYGLIKKTFFNVVDFGGNVVDHGYFEDYDEGLTLEAGAAKKMMQKKPRKCPGCGKVISIRECSCGYVFEVEEKEKIKIDNLEIEVLNKNIINYLRLSKKKWEQVKDHELRIYAKIKGMKNGWALHEYARRHTLPKTDGWNYFVNNKLAQLEKEHEAMYE